MYGGEDFELVYTVSPENLDKVDGVVVGEITEGSDIFLESKGERIKLIKSGFDHFK